MKTLIPDQISFQYAPQGLIDNMSVLIQVMAWHQTGNEPLSYPMMTQFTDTDICHSVSMS